MRKAKKPIMQSRLDMPQLFGQLIQERSLYAVLEALASACHTRANFHRHFVDDEKTSPLVRPLIEDEVEFFDEAGRSITEVRSIIEALSNSASAPACADGDWRRHRRRMAQVARDYFRALAVIISDPETSEERKREAVSILAKQAEGTVWMNRPTGEPDDAIADWFQNVTSALSDPETSEADRIGLGKAIEEFVNR